MDAQALLKAARRSGEQGDDNDCDDDDRDGGECQLATERAIAGDPFRLPGDPPFVEGRLRLMRWCGRRRPCRGYGRTFECHAIPHPQALVRAGPGRPRAQKSRSTNDSPATAVLLDFLNSHLFVARPLPAPGNAGLTWVDPELFNPAQRWPAPLPMLAAMQINERALGGLTILDLNGKLTIDNGAQLLKDKCESLVFQQRTQVIVNLAAVPYIDSGGLGQLVACYTTMAKAGGRLTLANINKTNHDLLSITKLVAVFETFDSEEAAVQSYPVGVRA